MKKTLIGIVAVGGLYAATLIAAASMTTNGLGEAEFSFRGEYPAWAAASATNAAPQKTTAAAYLYGGIERSARTRGTLLETDAPHGLVIKIR